MSKYEWKKLEDPQYWASEGGTALIAEDYDGTKICLERCERHDAITCGGGWVHTVFVGKDKSMQVYEEMKKDLQDFTDRVDEMSVEERCELYERFTKKFR